MDILSKLNTRYATKVFDKSKKVSESDMEKLLESIRLSASSLGLQPYKVLVVEDPEIRTELRKFSWNQSQITDASALLIFAVNYAADEKSAEEYIDLVSKTRKVTTESLASYTGMIKGTLVNLDKEQKETWVSKQAYIALGFGLVAAAVLGIDTCPMEGFSGADYDRILELDQLGLKSKVILAVGYRSPEDKYQHLPKVRQKKEDLFIKF